MKIYYIKIILWSLSLLLIVASVAVAFFGLQLPPHSYSEVDVSPSNRISSNISDKMEGDILPLDSFAKIWSLKLRKHLYDPPKASQKETISKPKTIIEIALLGLINEPGHSCAIVCTRDGKMKLLSVGEQLSDEAGIIEVVSIDDASITVRYEGELITIELKKNKNEIEFE